MLKKIIPIVLLTIAVVAVVEMKNKKRRDVSEGCADGLCVLTLSQEKMMPEGAGTNAAVKAQALPRILDLGAGKCVPCKAMAPILDEMEETFAGQLHVEFIDVWENEGVSEKYGIRMIPTQIFYDADGSELYRHEGFYSREDMLSKWQELGFNFSTDG